MSGRSSLGRLAHRRVLVTGAAEGIGAAIARLFCQHGASVVLTGRRAERGEATASALRDAGADASFVRADLTDEQAVGDVVKRCDELGGLDVVVNNASIAPSGPLEEMTIDAWNEVLACNLTTMFLVTKHALPLLRRSAHASVVNLGSTFGVVGAAGSAAYAMTKAAAISFSKSMALELAADGIRVNALCPGATETELYHRWVGETGGPDGAARELRGRYPTGRISTVEEQAWAALFLASDESRFVNGHALLVDGAFTAQ